MNNIIIYRATEDNVTEITAVLNSATQYKIAHGDVAWGTRGWAEKNVMGTLSTSDVYVIKKNEEIVGTFALQWEDEQYWGAQPTVAGYIHRLAIKDGFRGKGIGEFAINWSVEKVVSENREYLRLDCDANNSSLCAYYEKQKFTRVGIKPMPEYGDYIASLYQRER